MGTRSAPRAKAMAKRLRRLKNRSSRQVAGGENEFGVESATLGSATMNAGNGPAGSPAAVAEKWVESSEELTPIKQVAAAALILGQNVSKTASALGVDRRTIQRWRKLDPEFQLAMVETKQEVIVSSRQYILMLAESAVGAVETKLNDEQDARAALALLRNIGVVSPEALDGRQYEPWDEAASEGKPSEDEFRFRAQCATLDAEASTADARIADKQSHKIEDVESEEVYDLADLTSQQQVAVNAFYVGKPLADIAMLAQCPEATVRGWLCQDRAFFTVLSGLQFERIQHLKYRLFALIDQAMQIVKKAIAAKDGRIAMALLRGLGLMQ
jgi:hypothetical protein